MDAQPATSSMPRCGACKHKVLYNLTACFYRLGHLVAGNALATMLLCVTFSGLCSIGLLRFDWETEGDKLWVPQGTLELQHRSKAEEYFPAAIKMEQILVSRASGNIMTRGSLLQLIEVLKKSEAASVEVDGATVTYADLCMPTQRANTSYCHSTSVLDLFYDASFETVPSRGYLETVKAKIENSTATQIEQATAVSQLMSWTGNPLARDDIFGGVFNTRTGDMMSSAFRVTLYMRERPALEEWEKVWADTLEAITLDGSLSCEVKAARSFNDALADSLSRDLPKMLAGYVLFAAYVCFMMGRPHLVRMRLALGLQALLGVVLATIATAGIASAFGLFWGPVHTALPVLLFGIGVNHAFVLVNSFDRVNEVSPHPLREKLALALSKVSFAACLTSLTTSCSFFLWAQISVPALRHFAIWAGIGVLFVFMFQSTFFMACLSIDAYRQEQKRVDCLACFRRDTSGADLLGVESGVLRRFFENAFAPFLLRGPVRALVLLLVVALFGRYGYGISLLHPKFVPSAFYLDGTEIKSFHDAEQQFFPERHLPVHIYTGPAAYENGALQRQLLSLCTVVAKSSVVQAGSTTCWYSQMRQAFNLSDSEVFDAGSFYSKISIFLAGDGARFSSHLSFDKKGRLNASRFATRLKSLESNNAEVDAMRGLQEAVDSAQLEGAFPFAEQFTTFAHYAVLKREVFQSVALALAVVLILTLGMIGNPIVSLVVFVGVAGTVIDMLGFLYYRGDNLNSVTVITLALAVGVSVDSSVRIGLEFMESVGSRAERTSTALETLGPCLVHSGVSTLLIVSILVVAKSYVFRTLLWTLAVTLFLGMFHGLVFVPVVLSMIGPVGFYESAEEKRTANVRITTIQKRG